MIAFRFSPSVWNNKKQKKSENCMKARFDKRESNCFVHSGNSSNRKKSAARCGRKSSHLTRDRRLNTFSARVSGLWRNVVWTYVGLVEVSSNVYVDAPWNHRKWKKKRFDQRLTKDLEKIPISIHVGPWSAISIADSTNSFSLRAPRFSRCLLRRNSFSLSSEFYF